MVRSKRSRRATLNSITRYRRLRIEGEPFFFTVAPADRSVGRSADERGDIHSSAYSSIRALY
jgi:hypothetical protein